MAAEEVHGWKAGILAHYLRDQAAPGVRPGRRQRLLRPEPAARGRGGGDAGAHAPGALRRPAGTRHDPTAAAQRGRTFRCRAIRSRDRGGRAWRGRRPRSPPQGGRRRAGHRARRAASRRGRPQPSGDRAAAADGVARRRPRACARCAPVPAEAAPGRRWRHHGGGDRHRVAVAPPPQHRLVRAGLRPLDCAGRDRRGRTGAAPHRPARPGPRRLPGRGGRPCVCSSPVSCGAWRLAPGWSSSRRSTATAWAPNWAWPAPSATPWCGASTSSTCRSASTRSATARPPASRPRSPRRGPPARPWSPRPATTGSTRPASRRRSRG